MSGRRWEILKLRRGWKPPAELGHSRPRSVGLSGGGRALAILAIVLGAGALGAAAGLSAMVEQDVQAERRLRLEGAETSGRVTRLWRTRGKKPKHRVAYQFSVEGRTYGRQQVDIHPETWLRLRIGSALPVTYVPSDPEIHYALNWMEEPMPAWIPPLASFGLAALALLPLAAIRGQRRLLAEGRPAPAMITRHEKQQHGIVVHYEFPLLSGATCTGKNGPHKKPNAVGSSICVVYNPDRPEKNAQYPFSLVRIRLH